MFFIVLFGLIVLIIAMVIHQNKSDKSAEVVAKNLDVLVKNQGGHVAKEISYIQYPVRYRVIVDDRNKELRIFSGTDFEREKTIAFSDVLGFEAFKNGTSSASIGKAIVGGVIAGGVGALIGAKAGAKEKISSYTAYLYMKTLSDPSFELNFCLNGANTSDPRVQKADSFVADMTGVVRSIVLQYSN